MNHSPSLYQGLGFCAMIQTIPCRPATAKFIQFLLGVDEEGCVILLGRSPIVVLIDSLVSGKLTTHHRNGKRTEVILKEFTALLKVRFSFQHFVKCRFVLDQKTLLALDDLVSEMVTHELYIMAQTKRALGQSVKGMIYDFMVQTGTIDMPGINEPSLKKRLQRYEASMKHRRRLVMGTTKSP